LQISPGIKKETARNTNDKFYPLRGEIIRNDEKREKKKKKDGRIKIHKNLANPIFYLLMQGKEGGKVRSWLGIIPCGHYVTTNHYPLSLLESNRDGANSAIPVKRFALRQSGDPDHE
jgi:hypothetical protein